jgi:hypothetical protein
MTQPLAMLVALALAAAPAPPTATDDAPQEAAELRTQALRAFADGERAWAQADYEAAVEHFARAQRLVPHPFTQYNLGLAQHRAGAHADAWHTFDDLIAHAETDAQRRDAIRAQARVRAELAFVQVQAPPQVRVCFDGRPLALDHREMTTPGRHELTIDGRPLPLSLQPGETRVLDVGTAPRGDAARPAARRTSLALGILAATTAAAAAGLATGGLLTDDDPTRRGLTLGAAVSGGVALGSVTGLLVVNRDRTSGRRARRGRHATATPPTCAPVSTRDDDGAGVLRSPE